MSDTLIVVDNPERRSVIFTPKEADYVKEVGAKRQAPKDRPESLTGPAPYAKEMDGATRNTIGVKGEYALSKYLGIPIDEKIYAVRDDGSDFKLHGVRIDVKTTQGVLVAYKKSIFERCDIVVLANHKPDNYREVVLQGFITPDDFWHGPTFQWDFERGSGLDTCIQPVNLRPIASLKQHCWMMNHLQELFAAPKPSTFTRQISSLVTARP
jgi:hypothetical protein